ncbi:tRNA adenosine(34) deaminase TadA [Vagococcus xieshaowenii]|uniref:tRNA-specific adenosine deaminase n=1 Tax=Vagococcus xieshaowenii TaxID=2562451 RepID=A0AAJ5JL16_9ENTE|nr:tRNA adenosine(34) deaminase TadA [Vagococcus xieshaowenii]QCA29100.1 nucleoside deaminase [Vagococcus xieshaowenii]TFZ40924.1 nucleoside deaminase [Vagococcus xieshaowenii]
MTKEQRVYTLDEKVYYMEEAMKEAKRAQAKGEVPIGAVVVYEGVIVGRGHNLRETTQNAITHAEMMAIQDACQTLSSWRLEGCDLFVTLEPCVMCSGAIVLSRIEQVYYGAVDIKGGATESLYQLLSDERLNHQVVIEQGVLEEECSQLLTDFFKQIREKKKAHKLAKRAKLLKEENLKKD